MTKAEGKTTKPSKVGTRFRTIRVTSDVYDTIHKVVGDISQKGWKIFGVNRRDAASITSVVAEAVDRLARRAR